FALWALKAQPQRRLPPRPALRAPLVSIPFARFAELRAKGLTLQPAPPHARRVRPVTTAPATQMRSRAPREATTATRARRPALPAGSALSVIALQVLCVAECAVCCVCA